MIASIAPTADTVTWTVSTSDGRLSLRLPGGAVVRAITAKGKPGYWECQRCNATSAPGLRHDNPDHLRAFRAFLAEHAGATCPAPAPTTKRTRSP